jgi:hypothetical protein
MTHRLLAPTAYAYVQGAGSSEAIAGGSFPGSCAASPRRDQRTELLGMDLYPTRR